VLSEDYTYQVLNPGQFSVTLNPSESIEGELIFMPSEVSYMILTFMPSEVSYMIL